MSDHKESASVNHANEAVDIAIKAADYEPVQAAIAYGIRCIEHEYNVEFACQHCNVGGLHQQPE